MWERERERERERGRERENTQFGEILLENKQNLIRKEREREMARVRWDGIEREKWREKVTNQYQSSRADLFLRERGRERERRRSRKRRRERERGVTSDQERGRNNVKQNIFLYSMSHCGL